MTRSNFIMTFLVLFSLNCTSWCQASFLRSVTFDEIREGGGFGSKSLLTVSRIEASGDKLTKEEIGNFIASEYLKNVHSLYLIDQDLDDNFIENLCKNITLKRLINLDVSRNSKITNKSLQLILDSDLGSVRDLPQISGSYGIPSSTIYVTASKTSIQPKDGQRQITLHRLGFTIEYRHPVTDQMTDTTADYAIKFVECNF